MSKFSGLMPEALVKLLDPPEGKVSAVLDTDTYNEIDDQFALAYAVLADGIDLEAIYAAPFFNERSSGPADGMEKSYDEIRRLLGRLEGSRGPFSGRVLRGSPEYLPSPEAPVKSEAAEDLVERALRERSGPLYVLTIGVPTNIASAILMEPRICDRIVVVWLGGQPYYWYTARDFNLQQDLYASQLLFDSGVPLVHIPCKNVAEHLNTTVPELEYYLRGKNAICDYLFESARDLIAERNLLSKVIWDISTVAWLRVSECVPTHITASPVLTADYTWSSNPDRHLIRVAYDVRRDEVFRDLFSLLSG